MMSVSKKLSIAFYWHMHQPVYQLTENGDYIMPWVRLHGAKDYLDMMNWAKKFSNLKLNINFAPCLIDGLIDYADNNAHDIHSRLTVTPQDALTDKDKIYILNNFFDANYKTMISTNEEYKRLYQKVRSAENLDPSILTNQEYADLMALFNIVWTDPSFKVNNTELKALIEKGKNYSYEDRVRIIEIHREIIKKIIPTAKKLLKENKLEITTSPYFHPIIPILLDYKSIRHAGVLADELSELSTENDAKWQTKAALDRMEDVFGVRPRGIWPSEHCVSEKTLEMFSSEGVDWSISDEGVLASSLGCVFEHDFKGYINEPYHLLKAYDYKTPYANIKMIFRESTIPNLIYFEYPEHDPIETANDLYDRIKVMQSKILSSPDDDHLLTIALDGENCWENYQEDGVTFLKTLYTLITKDESLETVLISDYLDNTSENKELDEIASGSGLSKNFKLWIDEPVKDLAWTYLKRVRHDLEEYARNNPDNPNIEQAKKELMICEGSDWFWWFGEPNDSGRDNIFDYIYRTRLQNVYRYLDIEVPESLKEPITNMIACNNSTQPRKQISPELNGKNIISDEDVWNDAGCVEVPDGPVLRESKLFDRIRFGSDENYLYLKLHMNNYIRENSDLSKRTYQMYLYTRKAEGKQSLSPIRLISKTESFSPISQEKFHNEIQIAIKNGEVQLLRIIKSSQNDTWTLERSKTIETVCDEVLDMKIPFDLLDINKGETLEFLFINANYGIKDFCIPNENLLSVSRPIGVLRK